VKLGAYADDLMTLVASVQEWKALDGALRLYGNSSNARVNLSTTVAFPISTYSDPYLKAHLSSLHLQWPDNTTRVALTNLGFPIF
ncbi:MAG: hypothetical protein JOS17DRAFT_662914, partial [Linnemannia elongata]